MTKADEIPVEKQIFSEVWGFLKDCYKPVTEDDWRRLVAKANEITEKYADTVYHDLAKNLCIGVVEHMGRIKDGV